MRVAALLPPSFHKEDNMNTENIIDIAINFNDPEWILKHITIALQRTSDADFVKRPCDLEGIEQYLIVRGEQDDACYSAKVTSALLSNAGIDEDTAWEKALENLCADTQIKSLGKILSEMTGVPSECAEASTIKFHVITNSQKCKGASAIMNRKMLRDFTQNCRTNMLFVSPSSIHEMMIAPYDSRFKLEELSAMVKEINETQVAPEERLTDRAYILSL